MPKRKDTPAFDLEAEVPAMVGALQSRRVLKPADLKRFKVPPELQGQALGRLVAEGFEAIPGGVRVPLRLQLATLLRERPVLSASLGKLLKGGSATEYRNLLDELARTSQIQRLVRGKAEAVTGMATPVLARDEMRALGQLAGSVQKALRGKPLPRTLLREDVRELLLDLAGPAAAPAETQDPPDLGPLVTRRVSEAQRLLRPDLGLCFVPDLVLACLPDQSLGRIHQALGQAVRERRLELRPESGVHRLGRVELALCPEGFQETRLSWARPMEPRP
jgi:hypothetical protein